MAYQYPILDDYPIPKIMGRGRKGGVGRNQLQLRKMRVGQCIINVPYKKAMSFKNSAWRAGFKILIRKLPHNNLYLIKRIS